MAHAARGRIGVFNRSHYEEVLVVRVHPDLLAGQSVDPARADDSEFWKKRFEDISAWERHLTRSGTQVVKFFLHVSKAVQRGRLLDRLEQPDKNWKFSPADLRERILGGLLAGVPGRVTRYQHPSGALVRGPG